MENGEFHSYESITSDREVCPNQVDVCIEDDFSPAKMRSSSESDNTFSRITTEAVEKEVGAYTAPGASLYIVCYHLPVVVTRTNKPNNPFEVTWAESLIAKSDESVADSMCTNWIGNQNYLVIISIMSTIPDIILYLRYCFDSRFDGR
jgi:hypothetical protein